MRKVWFDNLQAEESLQVLRQVVLHRVREVEEILYNKEKEAIMECEECRKMKLLGMIPCDKCLDREERFRNNIVEENY